MSFELDQYHRNIPDDELLSDLRRVGQEAGTRRITKQLYSTLGQFNASTLIRRFGSWFEAIRRANLERSRNLNISAETLIADLTGVGAKLGLTAVTRDQYNQNGQFAASTLTKRFGSWGKALELAGLRKTRNINISNAELFENLAQIWLSLGRQPRYRDLESEYSRYSAGTYEDRFGTWRKALEAFVLWTQEPSREEVAKSAPPPCRVVKPKPSRATQDRQVVRSISWRLRAQVLMRDGATCRMCGARPEHGVRLHIDHMIPWSKGGPTTLENLRVLCQQCNVGKSDLDPRAAG